MATTTPLGDVKAVVTLKVAVMILSPPAVLVVHFVTASSFTASELSGALEEVAPILAIRSLMLTPMIAPSTSLKAWC